MVLRMQRAPADRGSERGRCRDIWLTDRVPVMQSALKNESRFAGNRFHYEYWTCGSYDPAALAYWKRRPRITKKYAISWKDGTAVREYSARVRPSTVLKMLDEHYFKHPLARHDKKHDGVAVLNEVVGEIDFEIPDNDFEDLEA